MSYELFKNLVESQVSQILMNSGRLPVNLVDDNEPATAEEDGDDDDDQRDIGDVSRDDIIAMVGRKQKNGQWQRRQLRRAPSQPRRAAPRQDARDET